MSVVRRATYITSSPLKLSHAISRPSVSSCSPHQQRNNSHVVKDGRPFRMAIIGSGPAGFYTAYKVMSSIENAVVDMYEHLPVPFGLVRFGVAPDHPEVKNCQHRFEEVASSPRFNFIGNIQVGKGLPLVSFRNQYNAILFAYGATKDRKLGIPGEDTLKGVYSARDFVGWYNGLPEHADLAPDLGCGEDAIIIGQGNVALDVARTLLTDIDALRKTDMTDYSLTALSESRIKRVRVVGRRGPMQAAFTIKEVRELLKLPSVSFEPIDSTLLPPNLDTFPRTPKRLSKLLSRGSSTSASVAKKTWSLDFLLSPTHFNASEKAPQELESVVFGRNSLIGDRHDPAAKAETTKLRATLPAKIAFRSIGYKSEPIDGMNDLGIVFDERQSVILNDGSGRVISSLSDGTRIPGMYCSGWVKRGPAGVIANTMEDAFATAEAMAMDWESNQPFMAGGQGWDGLKAEADRLSLRSISWSDWKRIDAAEIARGKNKGKPREKFATIQEMLSVLD